MEFQFTLYRKAKRGAADEYECSHVDDLIISLPQVITRVYNNTPVRSITLTLGNPLPVENLDTNIVAILTTMESLSIEAAESAPREVITAPAPVSITPVQGSLTSASAPSSPSTVPKLSVATKSSSSAKSSVSTKSSAPTTPPPQSISSLANNSDSSNFVDNSEILKRLEKLEQAVAINGSSTVPTSPPSVVPASPLTQFASQMQRQVMSSISAQTSPTEEFSALLTKKAEEEEKCIICHESYETYKYCLKCRQGLVCQLCSDKMRVAKNPKICPICRTDMPHLYVERKRGRPPKTPPPAENPPPRPQFPPSI